MKCVNRHCFTPGACEQRGFCIVGGETRATFTHPWRLFAVGILFWTLVAVAGAIVYSL